MARYIDANKFAERIKVSPAFRNINDGYWLQRVVLDLLDDMPTADIVPKSEVDKWKEINEQLHKEMSERMLEEVKVAKKYLAREIFEEMDGITELFIKGLIGELEMYDRLAELKKKYEEQIC